MKRETLKDLQIKYSLSDECIKDIEAYIYGRQAENIEQAEDILDVYIAFTPMNHKKDAQLLNDIAKAIRGHELTDIREAIVNYALILQDDSSWFKYKWHILDFLKKQRGKATHNYKRFLEGGDLYEALIAPKKLKEAKNKKVDYDQRLKARLYDNNI